jgi:mRNA interferase MazF
LPATADTIPLRGEVWDVHLPAPFGDHPVVVVMSNALIPRVSAIAAVMVTGTEGPGTTHIALDADAGVTKYSLSWANAADVQAVPTSRFRRRRGRLNPSELERLEDALRAVLAL